MLLVELIEKVRFTKPNFQEEYEEALRYPELQQLSVEDWVMKCRLGKAVYFSSLTNVGNTTENNVDAARQHWEDVEPEKKERFLANEGPIEMPIVILINGAYDLLGGNTRLTGCIMNGIDPIVWLVRV